MTKLTDVQRKALRAVAIRANDDGTLPEGAVFVSVEPNFPTRDVDLAAVVHLRTARALLAAGLITFGVDRYGEGQVFTISPEGRDLAAVAA